MTMEKGIYVILKRNGFLEPLPCPIDGSYRRGFLLESQLINLIAETASKTGKYEGMISPVPRDWRIKGDMALYFLNPQATLQFLEDFWCNYSSRYYDYAVLMSGAQIEKRKSEKRTLLARLFGGEK